LYYIAVDGRLSDQLKRICKEAVLLWHLLGETDENHKKPKDIWCVSNQEPPVYELKSITATSTCSVCILVVGMPGKGPC
jgi:hypothetical protein